jgi:hypothetical protein
MNSSECPDELLNVTYARLAVAWRAAGFAKLRPMTVGSGAT